MSAAKPAQKIGRFEVVRRIGSGGEGTVFQALDPELDRQVAIKLIHSDRVAADRPPLEGRMLARLRHPNIVSVFEVGKLGAMPYLVFEYVEGPTLKSFLARQGALALESAGKLMLQILDGAAHAHDRGVLHLDLTPVNVLVDPERIPRIMDFGLARGVGLLQPAEECPVGTLRYMSPEHFDGTELGAYTDVYALSLILFELVTGRPALEGGSAAAIMQRMRDASIDLGALAREPGLAPLAGVLRGGLERDPRARYPDAGAMRAALSAVLQGADLPVEGAAGPHSTVQFFLRRMERKQDFPGLSRSLADINRLTSSESKASNEHLANAILRDYALTNKLLKLANSAFYGGGGNREVTNVTQAIRLLGFEQVRMAANSLCYAAHLQSKAENRELKEALTRSFMSGLITRHLARQAKLPGMEEAFISGMFRNIGQHLTLYYFPEEHADIEAFGAQHGLTLAAAARRLLGVSFAELGAGVARAWKLPNSILDVIEASPDGEPVGGAAPAHRLRNCAVFANELCAIPGSGDAPLQAASLRALCARFAVALAIDERSGYRVLEAALEKLARFAPVLGVNPERSEFCSKLGEWLRWSHDERQPEPLAATEPAAR